MNQQKYQLLLQRVKYYLLKHTVINIIHLKNKELKNEYI